MNKMKEARKVQIEDKLNLCIRQDARAANSGGELEKHVSGKVEELHSHFAVLRMYAEYRECFSYWELERITV